MDNGTQRDRLITFIESKRMTRREFQDSIGVSISYVHNMSGSIRQPILSRIEETYPELNIDWLVNGKGEMLNDRKKRVINQMKSDTEVATMIGIESMIPLLPTSAMAGKLTDFSDGIDERSCELMISPIRDAELAITVTGDSMSPEYPSGSKIILKKINESAFIDWGRTYVLDTINGAVIKNLYPSEKENCVKCVSINPEYPTFDVNLEDVFGVYRVLMCLSLK